MVKKGRDKWTKLNKLFLFLWCFITFWGSIYAQMPTDIFGNKYGDPFNPGAIIGASVATLVNFVFGVILLKIWKALLESWHERVSRKALQEEHDNR